MKNETFTPERIKAEADAFFEWDGEDRSLVTTTSCLLFAQHIAGLMQARAAQPAPVVPEGWRVFLSTSAGLRDGDRWEVYGPNGGGIVSTHDVKDWAVRGLLDALADAPAQGQQVECQECERLRADFEELAERYGKLQAGEGALLAKVVTERDQARAELAALKAQQVGQEPVYLYRRKGLDSWATCDEDRYEELAAHSLFDVKVCYDVTQPALAQDVAGWIPVTERLPEVETDVLVRGVRRNEVMHRVAGLFNGEWSSQETEDLLLGEVTHWMPLPAASALSADACNVDREDQWKLYSEDFVADVEAMLAAAPAQPAAQGEFGDAYQGAREDLTIWKRRALEAEEKLRDQCDGQSFMGEPLVLPYEAPREKIEALFKHLGFSGQVSVGEILDTALSALKAQQGDQYPHCDYCGTIPSYHPWHGSGILNGVESRHIHACGECRHKLPIWPQPAPAQDVAGLASSDPAAKAEFETLLRKEFESRWPKPKGVTWGAGINDYCVSEFAEGISLSYPDMWMAYKAGAMRANQ